MTARVTIQFRSGELSSIQSGDQIVSAGEEKPEEEREYTVEEIIQQCKRFRIVSVGPAGVGKSSLINCVFKCNDAKVSDWKKGEAKIGDEITSEINPHFVLHDSKGFEPGNLDTFEIVEKFVIEKSAQNLKLSERLHAVWLCIRTPTHGARVIEAGTEKFLELANERKIPVVVVFTQYDRLTRGYQDKPEGFDAEASAQRDFDVSVESLRSTAKKLKIEMPKYVNVFVRPKEEHNIIELIELTRQTVQERLRGDAWVVWAMAQRASLPLKVEACVSKGMNYYWLARGGSVPGLSNLLLSQCLQQVHRDIVACWNFRDGATVLNSDEFKHLMVYLVQDIKNKDGPKSSPADIGNLSNFVTLCTAASATLAPPAAVLGLTYLFLKWLSNATLDNNPEVRRVMIAYTVDMILILEELFKFTLVPTSDGIVTWKLLQEAFEAHHRTTAQNSVHTDIATRVEQTWRLDTNQDIVLEGVRDLLQQHRVV
ncbi:hypothetical protein MVEN_01968800 [Mycena venus]|uniref:G domain-containing protein n=1 Tax=Mycena venus TaxID=2733690 RepID=A0A8H6XCR1_9AGAR|nr:hypothetical protein MVEN_01968800 [Mycena venus]